MPPALRSILGLLLVGYGILVLVQVLPHDAPIVGAASLVVGVAFLWRDLPQLKLGRSRIVASLGAGAVVGVLAYNVWRHSDLGPAEWAILAYGLGLVAASPFLGRRIGRTDVSTLVGWSFPLVLAPLALFAVNAGLSNTGAGSAATPLVARLVVAPTAWGLRLLGTPVEVSANQLLLATPRGDLTLGVGVVCAGLYPMVLFTGLVALHSWQQGMRPRVLAACLALGISSLWVLNIVRLVLLAKVGIAWGPAALQQAHAHLGWIFFAVFAAVFWTTILRRLEPPAQRKMGE